jgi:hypothetical protein
VWTWKSGRVKGKIFVGMGKGIEVELARLRLRLKLDPRLSPLSFV